MKNIFLEKIKRKMKNWKKQEETDAYWKREFYHLDATKEEVEWKIVKTDTGQFIRRPFPVGKKL